MKDLEQHQTISSGLKGNRSQYGLLNPPSAKHISYKPEMVGEQYGWVKIISAEKHWNQKQNHCYVLTQCVGCGSVQWQDLNSLKSGKSKGCQACSQPKQIPIWLEKRLSAAKQRCINPRDPNYKNYGARGIKWCFHSVLEAGLWILQEVDNVRKDWELDRINTNGNYEKGNIRFVPRIVNQNNKQNAILTRWEQQYWPYARSVVTRMLSKGIGREEIISRANTAIVQHRKNWRLIEARLEFMTYEMPDQIIVLPYRESSCITVATVVQ